MSDGICKIELLGILDRAEAELKKGNKNENLNLSLNQYPSPSDDAGAILLPESGGQASPLGR
jgi:hypothetical protein